MYNCCGLAPNDPGLSRRYDFQPRRTHKSGLTGSQFKVKSFIVVGARNGADRYEK
jgi:hypothetical protein